MRLERLKYIRENLEFTQSDVANKINVSRSTYSGWELGIDDIPLLRLNSVCNVLNINMDYITGLSNEKITNIIKNEINLKELGMNMKHVRVNAGDSQEYIAKIIGTTQSTYSKYENGNHIILTIFLIEFAKHYKVSIDRLCGKIK